MPLYEYECSACKHRFEVLQKFSDDPVKGCSRCNAPVHRLLSSPAIQFKGTGWYVTDYAKSGSGGDGKTTKPDGDAVKASTEPNPTESKTASTSSSGSPAKS
ncbi:MAG: zinc ribbon domain-containing protein [Acidobacteria bacterium]|nr:zinc ribbon domain-containing protein [Acidobacteriota bacterium]